MQAVRERALRATAALEQAGIPYCVARGNAVAAWVARVDWADDYCIASLDAVVRMKLNAFRDKDRTYLRDLISLGLVDASWLPRLVSEHAVRLQQLLDDPDG